MLTVCCNPHMTSFSLILMYRRLGLVVAACLLMHGPAAAVDEGGEGTLKELLKVMREEVEAGKDKPTGVDTGKLRMVSFVERNSKEPVLERVITDHYLGDIERLFSQPAVHQAVTKLRDEISRKDKEAEEAQVAAAEASLERLKQAVKTAKEPSEMDPILEELTKFSGMLILQANRERNLPLRIGNARAFASSWQDYLSAMKNNDANAARQALGGLKSSERLGGFLPRSEILALEAKLTSPPGVATEIVIGIRSLDEISAAITKLQEGRRNYDSDSISRVISALSGIDRNYREFKEGLSVSVQFNSYGTLSPPEVATKIAELRAQFLKLAIPRYVNAPNEAEAKDDESVIDFISRLEEEAKAADNPALALRLRDLKTTLNRGSSYSSQDVIGIDAYTAGRNQEEAKQFELAVLSYQQALKSGSDLVPIKAVGERLEAIKAAHPAEYAAGVERFLAPSQYPEGMPPGRSPNATPTIVIPASEATPPVDPSRLVLPSRPEPGKPESTKDEHAEKEGSPTQEPPKQEKNQAPTKAPPEH